MQEVLSSKLGMAVISRHKMLALEYLLGSVVV
jgi:hypothetical protein